MKLYYENVNPNKLHEELVSHNIFPTSVENDLEKVWITMPEDTTEEVLSEIASIVENHNKEIIPSKAEINKLVVENIRQKYSVDDEFQMQRLGLQDSSNGEYQAYLNYINGCIAWGDAEKQKYGY